MKKISPIKCKWNVMRYKEGWPSGFVEEKVAISVELDEDKLKKEIEDGGLHTVTMSKEQYETVFKPLFAEISRLNKEVRELNKES